MRYAALLRGINVGRKTVKMDVLKKSLEDLGCTNVRTILASGNVVLDLDEQNKETVKETLEKQLEKTFGFPIQILLRTAEDIHALVRINPFKHIPVTPDTRLYVTFLSEKPTYALKIPYESPEKDFVVVSVTDNAVCSALTLSSNRNTTEIMKFIEKIFGKNVTTRNWNTLSKVIKFLD